MIEGLFAGIDVTQEPGQVAGKSLTVLSTPYGTRYYVYPRGEVMWSIMADEPQLSEILGALP